jgi:hypothetical protein
MQGLAQWLASFRSLKPDEIAFIFEDSNEFVQNSSDETTQKSGQDVYGWGLKHDFVEAEPWQTYALKPIGVGIHRGAAKKNRLTWKELSNKSRKSARIAITGRFVLWVCLRCGTMRETSPPMLETTSTEQSPASSWTIR